MCHLAVVGAILRDRQALVFKGLIPGGHGGPPLQNHFSEITVFFQKTYVPGYSPVCFGGFPPHFASFAVKVDSSSLNFKGIPMAHDHPHEHEGPELSEKEIE